MCSGRLMGGKRARKCIRFLIVSTAPHLQIGNIRLYYPNGCSDFILSTVSNGRAINGRGYCIEIDVLRNVNVFDVVPVDENFCVVQGLASSIYFQIFS